MRQRRRCYAWRSPWPWALPFVVGWLLCSGGSLSAREWTPSDYALLLSMTEDIATARLLLAKSAQALTDSRASLRLQGELLKESERRVSRLSASLQLWREHSDELERSLDRLASELTTLKVALRKLTDAYNALSKLHGNYVVTVDKAIAGLTRSRNVWRGLAIGAGAAAVVAALVALLT